MYQRLQDCNKFPDFNNYLTFILTQYTVRSLALASPSVRGGLPRA